MSCGIGCRRGSDPTLLWLWCRPVATAPIRPPAWELPYAVGVALKRKRKKERKKLLLSFILCICLFVCLFALSWAAPAAEVPRLGVESEPWPPAYTRATATQDPSRVCNLYHSSWQRRIVNPLSKGRDRTRNLMVPSRIR